MADKQIEELYESVIQGMIEEAMDWDIEKFASRTVQLLILDRGNLNQYKQTLEVILKVFEAVTLAKAKG